MHSLRIYPTFRDTTTSFWEETGSGVEKCRLFSLATANTAGCETN